MNAVLAWRDVALVAAGGALGAVARLAVSALPPRAEFPWHTLAINLAGSFVLGYLLLGQGMEHPWRLAVAVGFLGAFTTLSTYSAETIGLWREGHALWAGLNIAGNALGGPLLAWLGWRAAAS